MIFEDLPKEIRARFEERGILGLKECVKSDMLPDGTFGILWVGVDEEYLYLLSGKEKRVRRRGKPTKTEFEETSFDLLPIKDLGKCKVERYFATARLVCEKEGEEPRELLKFSLGAANEINKLLRHLGDKRGEDSSEGGPAQGNRGRHGPPPPPPSAEKSEEEKKAKRKSTIRRMLGMFKDYRRLLIRYFIVILISAAFGLLSPYVGTKVLYDNVLQEGDPWYGQVGLFILMLIGVRLISMGLTMLERKFFGADIAPSVTYDLKTKIFASLQRLDMGFYTDKQTGALMNRVYDDAEELYWFFCDILPFCVINIATLIGITIILFLLNPLLAAMVIVMVPLMFFIYRGLTRFFRRMHHRRWTYRSAMVSQVSETVTGQRIVKAFAKEKEEVDRFSAYSDRFRKVSLQLQNMQATVFPAVGLLTVFANMAVLGVGGTMILQDNGFTLGALMTFTTYLNMLYSPIEYIAHMSTELMRCIDSAERVFEIIDTVPNVRESDNPVSLPRLKGDIELKNVMFEYEPGRPIIKDLSLKVNAGQMVGIVGKTGAGKSTIVNLMARLYDVKEGTITIDGVNIKDIAIKDLRRNIGIVSQEIYLFTGTVADNIRYARPEASDEEVIAAAKAAAAHEFILKLPNGYETRIGADGQDLSGGERQRVSIARAILQNPKILILDEATASMDTVTERKIQEALSALQQGRTTVSIAHRLSTLRDADRLAVIEKGDMVEYGTHEELIRQKGVYYKLYMLQAEASKQIALAE
ncbi:MAG: ABC transporter ATP-binding protein [Clostridia bacterium]|nr:ABC transporter ATP-binding protein [Clostridia bacterium]